jgi:hypothetical protein
VFGLKIIPPLHGDCADALRAVSTITIARSKRDKVRCSEIIGSSSGWVS